MPMMVTHDEHITADPKNVILLAAVLRILLFGCAHFRLQRWSTIGSTTCIVFLKCYKNQYFLIDVASHVAVSDHLSVHDVCNVFASCPRGFGVWEGVEKAFISLFFKIVQKPLVL